MGSILQKAQALTVRFARDDSGATAIEYAMIGSGIGIAIAASVYQLGTDLAALYESFGSFFQD